MNGASSVLGKHSIPYSSPQPHPYQTAHRLPQEPFPRLQHLLMQLKLIPLKHRAHNQHQLHLRNISAYTRPRSITEWDERVHLPFCQSLLVPAIRVELFSVSTPDLGAVVNGVGGNGQDGVSWEVVPENCDSGTSGNETG